MRVEILSPLSHPTVPHSKKILYLIPIGTAAVLSALLSVAYARVFGYMEHLSLAYLGNHIHMVFVITPLAFLSSWALVDFFSPEAGGAGIPQLIAAVNIASERPHSPVIGRLLSLRVILVKFVGSCLCVGGGGSTGREGPTLQMTASLFLYIQNKIPKRYAHVSLPSMILAGGAAGLAAAFNTPLGGIVFATEELARVHLSQIRGVLLQAVLISGLVAQYLSGSYLYLGPVHPGNLNFSLLARIVLLGVITGVLGGFFARFIVRVIIWRRGLTKRKHRALFALTCGFFLAALAWLCGPSTLGSGREVIVDLLFHQDSDGSLRLAIGRIFGNFATYASGVAGGVFAPALAAGAAVSSVGMGMFPPESHQLAIMVGMAAFLSGVTHTPLTSIVLVIEMTEGHALILPLMLGVGSAYFATKLVEPRSFYERASELFTSDPTGK